MIKKSCFSCAYFEKCNHFGDKTKEDIRQNINGLQNIWGSKCEDFILKEQKERVNFT